MQALRCDTHTALKEHPYLRGIKQEVIWIYTARYIKLSVEAVIRFGRVHVEYAT